MRFIDIAKKTWAAPACAFTAWLVGCHSPMPPDTSRPGVPGVPMPAATAPGPAARLVGTWTEYKILAAQRLVDANPEVTYMGEVPEPLLAIPVIEVELNGDGSIRQIVVLRHPSQAEDTVQIAIDAIKRAAPFGDVRHLPKPWKMAEVFLFDGSRRFKPRTLDQ